MGKSTLFSAPALFIFILKKKGRNDIAPMPYRSCLIGF